jgi:putative endonuclease
MKWRGGQRGRGCKHFLSGVAPYRTVKSGGATPTLTQGVQKLVFACNPYGLRSKKLKIPNVIQRYKQQLGKSGEDLAVSFLKENGFEILERNYRYGHKEIDIIGKDKNTIAFVEVKTGRSKNFGAPQGWVTLRKQKSMIEVALDFIQKNDFRDFDFRFDVVAISLERGNAKIEHIENAFMVD